MGRRMCWALSNLAMRDSSKLSDGERQRFMIARALSAGAVDSASRRTHCISRRAFARGAEWPFSVILRGRKNLAIVMSTARSRACVAPGRHALAGHAERATVRRRSRRHDSRRRYRRGIPIAERFAFCRKSALSGCCHIIKPPRLGGRPRLPATLARAVLETRRFRGFAWRRKAASVLRSLWLLKDAGGRLRQQNVVATGTTFEGLRKTRSAADGC